MQNIFLGKTGQIGNLEYGFAMYFIYLGKNSIQTTRPGGYEGMKEKNMTEREIERILSEEADEAKVQQAIKKYLRGVADDN